MSEQHWFADAHDIPFEEATFDGVIVQAVLEHVADPHRCVEQIHRVLKTGGVVYADTPFMQQVHAGGHDFTRFTHVGQRRLFRKFEEVSSGASCGPAMALAWAYQYFLLSFVRSKTARRAAIAFARVTGFWLKYLDHYLIRRAGGHRRSFRDLLLREKKQAQPFGCRDHQLLSGSAGRLVQSATNTATYRFPLWRGKPVETG